MKTEGTYYVYIHRNRKTGEIFYVGKGKGNRITETNRRNAEWKKYVSEGSVDIEFLMIQENLTERGALELEMMIIERFQSLYPDRLTNTDGTDKEFNGMYISIGMQNSTDNRDVKPRFEGIDASEIQIVLTTFPGYEVYREYATKLEKLKDHFDDLSCEEEVSEWDDLFELEDILYELEDILNVHKLNETLQLEKLSSETKGLLKELATIDKPDAPNMVTLMTDLESLITDLVFVSES